MQPEMNSSELLPCRGCTRNCPNIEVCDHRPWRCAPGAYSDSDTAASAESSQT